MKKYRKQEARKSKYNVYIIGPVLDQPNCMYVVATTPVRKLDGTYIKQVHFVLN